MGNLEIYDKLKRPPENVLKPITAGRLKGKSDINPQWRIKAMTEQFGPCGIGWKFTIDRTWTEQGDNMQVMAFVVVSVFIKQGETWSEAIPGVGGSMLVVRETSGLHSSDEAFKMATTDALSVAFKYLGVAADIYMGLWDGSKYKVGADDTTELYTVENLKDNITKGLADAKFTDLERDDFKRRMNDVLPKIADKESAEYKQELMGFSDEIQATIKARTDKKMPGWSK